jgi:predicted transcriptional regulator
MTVHLDEGVRERLDALAPGAGYLDAEHIAREAIGRRLHELERGRRGALAPLHSTPAQGERGHAGDE